MTLYCGFTVVRMWLTNLSLLALPFLEKAKFRNLYIIEDTKRAECFRNQHYIAIII